MISHFAYPLFSIMANESNCGAIKLTLQRHVEIFEECDDCMSVLSLLRANNIISEWNYQQITAQRTPTERNRYLK